MHDTLTKPWAEHEAGTAVADNAAEAAELGAVEVAPDRFAYLKERGFFKPEPARPAPKAAPAASSVDEPAPPAAGDIAVKEEVT